LCIKDSYVKIVYDDYINEDSGGKKARETQKARQAISEAKREME
jgi:hypothetical protein